MFRQLSVFTELALRQLKTKLLHEFQTVGCRREILPEDMQTVEKTVVQI